MEQPTAESMSLTDVNAFHRLVAKAWQPAIWSRHGVLIAVSGGPDSVALLLALHELWKGEQPCPGKLAIAHINHALRGQDSDLDQDSVESLGTKLGLPVFSRRLDRAAWEVHRGDGMEAAARSARYELLFQIAHEIGARYLAIGHTRDDQIETVLFRIFRGSGIAGLAGIPAMRRVDQSLTIVRPLLNASRAQVHLYLAAMGQEARTDESNSDTNLATRNWIRSELLPIIRARFGGHADVAIAQLAAFAQEIHQFVVGKAEPLLDDALVDCGTGYAILRRERLQGHSPIVIQSAAQRLWVRQAWPLQEMGVEHWQRLTQLILEAGTDQPSETDFPGQIRISLRGEHIYLNRKSDVPGSEAS